MQFLIIKIIKHLKVRVWGGGGGSVMGIGDPGYGYILSPANGNGFKAISNNAMQCIRALYIYIRPLSQKGME